MPKAAIFDLDGTLLDSVDLHAIAWHEAMAKFGHDVSYEQPRSQIGKGGDKLIPVFLSADEQRDHGKEMEEWRGERFKTAYLPLVRPFSAVPDRRAVDEGSLGGVGRRQQPIPPGCGEGEPRSGRRRRDPGEAWRRPQAPRGVRRALRRARRTAEKSRSRRIEEAGPEAISQGKDVFSPGGQGGGPEGSSSVRTRAPASRARGSQGRGGQTEETRT